MYKINELKFLTAGMPRRTKGSYKEAFETAKAVG